MSIWAFLGISSDCWFFHRKTETYTGYKEKQIIITLHKTATTQSANNDDNDDEETGRRSTKLNEKRYHNNNNNDDHYCTTPFSSGTSHLAVLGNLSVVPTTNVMFSSHVHSSRRSHSGRNRRAFMDSVDGGTVNIGSGLNFDVSFLCANLQFVYYRQKTVNEWNLMDGNQVRSRSMWSGDGHLLP